MDPMATFFKARTVAVIGAARETHKIGHVMFRNFLDSGFGGRVYPVNQKAKKILGRRCYPSVMDVPGRVDLAVVSVPAKAVRQVIQECGKKRVRSAIIITSGFGEIGNTAGEEEIRVELKRQGIRAIGVNCLGVFDPKTGVDTLFLPRHRLERPKPGHISFMSQSGAIGSIVLDWMAMKGYELSKFISYGNATDVDETDLLEFLARDRDTRVICMYLEGVKRGREFYRAAKRISKRKPIIVLKGGTTEEGTKAVSSHTGSLAGSDSIYNAVFEQAGIIRAGDLEQIFDFARMLSTQPKPRGDRVQVVTDGGGFGIMMTDWLVKNGLSMAKLSEKTVKTLKSKASAYTIIKNPMDLTGAATAGMYKLAIDACMRDRNVDMVVAIVLFQVPQLTSEVIEILTEANRKKSKPFVVVAAGGRYTETMKKKLEASGIPCFSYPERASQALNALREFAGG